MNSFTRNARLVVKACQRYAYYCDVCDGWFTVGIIIGLLTLVIAKIVGVI